MLRCLIIEDEPLAAEILSDYIRDAPGLELAGVCSDALFALEFLQRERVDVLFLDIHLPKLKGLDFLKTLSHPPQVILTTAYHEYALEGYELAVTDYLLKPIEFSRFLKAVQKLQHPVAQIEPLPAPQTPERPAYFFNVGKKRVKVYFDEILYAESLKEYVRIFLPGRSVVTKMQLGELESLLGSAGFVRIHRSFLVAKSKIDAYSATEVEVGGKTLPIGRSYREVGLE
ncbi:MAG: response regulator transcription factor [Saprospiraceae bacterium]|nr:response regulator transcription factor [Saprospiraceae bacterium]